MNLAAQQVIEMAAEAFMLGRLAVVPDLSGALYLPDERTLVVADLHLEKGSAYAARGVLLPPYDSAATLRLLGAAILRYQPARVIALGDSFHDRGAEARIDESCLATLRACQAGRDWFWVSGNHDPSISAAMGGTVLDELDIRGVRLRHEPSPRSPAICTPPPRSACAAGRCAGAALRCRRAAASCRRWAPMPAASTSATPPFGHCSAWVSRPISSATAGSSASTSAYCCRTENRGP